jgi:cation:H+ antiporter
MNEILTYVLFAVGFPALIFGAQWLVDGAASIAKRFNVSDMVIGLTIVSIGTSAPELAVNILASAEGASGIAIGNVAGSNIVNILVIAGITAIIAPMIVGREYYKRGIPIMVLAGIVFFLLANDTLIDGAKDSIISRIDGLIMLLFFGIYLYYTMYLGKKMKNQDAEMDQAVKPKNLMISVVLILGGLVCLVLGGNWVVDGAVLLARFFGMSEAMIGVTIVAVGTSLPEIATSIVAARKGKAEMAVGNIVGSNIFNVFFVLGLSAVIAPLSFNPSMNSDLIMVIIASLMFYVFVYTGKGRMISRVEGSIFILSYVAYVCYAVGLF